MPLCKICSTNVTTGVVIHSKCFEAIPSIVRCSECVYRTVQGTCLHCNGLKNTSVLGVFCSFGIKRELGIKENYKKTNCINSLLVIGDLVLSTDGDSYRHLIGRVTDIHPIGSPERETDNTEDDVYVDLSNNEYSLKRIKEIEVMFSELYNEPKQFDELPLGEVIMEPSTLIRITDIDADELNFILESEENAEIYIEKTLVELLATKGSF